VRPAAYASWSMTETEKFYAQIDKKALAVGMSKFSAYILG